MTLPRTNIQMILGTSKTLTINVTDENGDEEDLTNATIYFTIKLTLAGAALVSKTSDEPLEIAIPDQSTNPGEAYIYLVPDDTDGLTAVPHFYDVWIVRATGERFAVIEPGKVYFEQPVTVIP